jgi:hypothetical protein
MSTKTSFKRIALVTASALAIAGFSAVPAHAADIVSVATAAVTTTPNAATATPGKAGTEIVANINIGSTAQMINTDVLTFTLALADPNGTVVTSSLLTTATAGAIATNATASAPAANSLRLTATGNANITAGVTAGTVRFTPAMGGKYVLTSVTTVAGASTNSPVEIAQDIFVSGAGAVVAASGVGTSAATAVTGGIATVRFGTAAHTAVQVYNLTSSGVGSIQTVAVGLNTPSQAGIAAASDYSVGARITTSNNTNFNDVTATVASTVAGVQTLTWTSLSATTGAPTVVATATVTWGAATVVGTVSAGNSTSILSTDLLTPFVGTADETISVINTANARAATIKVILNDTQATPAAIATKAVTATISGSGLLGGSTGTGTTLAYTDATVTGTVGRSITVNTDALGQAFFGVFADGSSGKGTITITQGTTTIATETVTFFGAVASFKATVMKNVVASGAATTAALDVVALDANSVVVPSVGITVTSGTVATIASFTETTSSAAEAAAGTAVVDVTGVSATFGSVVLTIKDTATGLISTTATVKVGALEAATVSAAFDKTSYTPGQLVTLTITAKDANAADVGDSITATSLVITTNAAVQGTMPTSTGFVLGKQVITFFAPSVTVPLSASIKLASGAAWSTALDDTTITVSATVVDAAQTALLTQIDALNAKIVALNALIAKIMKKLGVK